MSVFPGAVSFARAPTDVFDVYGPRDWADDAGRHAVSATPVSWAIGLSFPSNPYAGIGYHMEARFFGDYGPLSGQAIEGFGSDNHFCKLNIGGADIVTIMNPASTNPTPDSGFFQITTSGAIVLFDWTGGTTGTTYTSTHLQYRFVRP